MLHPSLCASSVKQERQLGSSLFSLTSFQFLFWALHSWLTLTRKGYYLRFFTTTYFQTMLTMSGLCSSFNRTGRASYFKSLETGKKLHSWKWLFIFRQWEKSPPVILWGFTSIPPNHFTNKTWHMAHPYLLLHESTTLWPRCSKMCPFESVQSPLKKS